VINSGYELARAYFGLARVDEALSLYKKAKDKADKAHQLDPNDPDIQKYWIETLSLNERIKNLEEYLATIKNDDAKTREDLQHSLEYLKARQQAPLRSCKLIDNVASPQTNAVPLLQDPKNLMSGVRLSVSVNGTKAILLLDTGASGIMIDRGIADKAGLTRLSETRMGGIGDKGSKAGWISLANSIKIGELEFQNCPVEVLDKRSVVEENGLIGTDVFEDFLVDVNLPERTLRLSELPKRPGETERVIKLTTDKDDSGSERAANDPDQSSKAVSAPPSGPFDAYISPAMTNYSRIFRFGHLLLIPTRIGDASPKLFLIDTGANKDNIDPAAAREVTKVHGDSPVFIKGLSGSVKKVYRADVAVLTFGNLKQENQDIVSFDMTPLSEDIGTQISGILGFNTLYLLDIKIDYRDGLVYFSYDSDPLHLTPFHVLP
jgi:predicted aspartyl protease